MKRLKQMLRWVEIVLAATVASVLIVNAWLVWRSDTLLERQLAAIRQVGDPTSMADLAPQAIPAGENAATYLRQAHTEISAVYRAMVRVRGVFPQSERLPHPGAASVRQALKRILEAHPNAMPLLEQAAACRECDWQLDYTLPPFESSTQSAKVASYYAVYTRVLLYGRAIPLLTEGKGDEAVRTIVQSLQLVRQTDRNPSLIAYMVAVRDRGIAMECANVALRVGPVSQQVRDALDAELAIQDRMDGYVWAIRSQRASFLDEFETIPHRQDWFINRVIYNQQESDCLESLAFDLARTLDSRPYRDAKRLIDETPRKAWGVGGGMLPEIKLSQLPVARLRAKIRVLRVLNAAQAHLPADGAEVPRLSELGLPAEATTDPFTGEPLHVKKRAKGWLIYSVGENFQDDGGSSNTPHDDISAGALSSAGNAAETVSSRHVR
jgi:hypothetical protein